MHASISYVSNYAYFVHSVILPIVAIRLQTNRAFVHVCRFRSYSDMFRICSRFAS